MARRIVIVADPGIDSAFALALALKDRGIDVLAIAATAGNVSAEQATRNVQTVVSQVDPPRLPRIGTALPVTYDTDGTQLHGSGGLGGISFPSVDLHQAHPSDKVIADQVTFGSSRWPFTLARPEAVDYAAEKFPGTFAGLEQALVLPWNERMTDEHIDFLGSSIRAAVESVQASA